MYYNRKNATSASADFGVGLSRRFFVSRLEGWWRAPYLAETRAFRNSGELRACQMMCTPVYIHNCILSCIFSQGRGISDFAFGRVGRGTGSYWQEGYTRLFAVILGEVQRRK